MFSPVVFGLALGVIAIWALAFYGVILLYRRGMKRLPFFRRIFEPRQPRELQLGERMLILWVSAGLLIMALLSL